MRRVIQTCEHLVWKKNILFPVLSTSSNKAQNRSFKSFTEQKITKDYVIWKITRKEIYNNLDEFNYHFQEHLSKIRRWMSEGSVTMSRF